MTENSREIPIPEQMVVEVFDGHMVKADGETPWADSRHLLWRVGPDRWVENVTAERLAG